MEIDSLSIDTLNIDRPNRDNIKVDEWILE